MTAVRVVVHGDVQGVFFRDSCRREAQKCGVVGWVRNGSDGTVEAVFHGAAGPVQGMVDWCKSGSPAAKVEHVDVSDAAVCDLADFEVRD